MNAKKILLPECIKADFNVAAIGNMRKIMLVLLFVLCAFTSANAQKRHVKEAYMYTHLMSQNPDLSVNIDCDIPGVIMFVSENGADYISISLEKDLTYYGKVVKEEREPGLISYKFYRKFGGVDVPIVLSKVYDNESDAVPSKIFLVVLNRYSMKPVQYNFFTGLKKYR